MQQQSKSKITKKLKLNKNKRQKTKIKINKKQKSKIPKQNPPKNLNFVILIVVAYCTQLLSQAMYNLMMAAMAETCSC